MMLHPGAGAQQGEQESDSKRGAQNDTNKLHRRAATKVLKPVKTHTHQDGLWARGKGMAHPQQVNSTVIGLTYRRWRWCVQPVLLSSPCVNTEQALERVARGVTFGCCACAYHWTAPLPSFMHSAPLHCPLQLSACPSAVGFRLGL